MGRPPSTGSGWTALRTRRPFVSFDCALRPFDCALRRAQESLRTPHPPSTSSGQAYPLSIALSCGRCAVAHLGRWRGGIGGKGRGGCVGRPFDSALRPFDCAQDRLRSGRTESLGRPFVSFDSAQDERTGGADERTREWTKGPDEPGSLDWLPPSAPRRSCRAARARTMKGPRRGRPAHAGREDLGEPSRSPGRRRARPALCRPAPGP